MAYSDDPARSGEGMMGSVKEAAKSKYEDVRERAQEYYEHGKERAHEMAHTIESRIQDRPFQAVLIAACVSIGLGFLLGAMTRR